MPTDLETQFRHLVHAVINEMRFKEASVPESLLRNIQDILNRRVQKYVHTCVTEDHSPIEMANRLFQKGLNRVLMHDPGTSNASERDAAIYGHSHLAEVKAKVLAVIRQAQ